MWQLVGSRRYGRAQWESIGETQGQYVGADQRELNRTAMGVTGLLPSLLAYGEPWWWERFGDYCAVYPPSTGRAMPVT